MKKAGFVAALVAGAALLSALPSWAQFQRYDYTYARSTNGAALTLDGNLSEPQWAQAESLVINGGQIGPIPGSGFYNEFIAPGVTPSDPNRAVFKFLVVGNQLWVGATVRDSSIGGNIEFNRFDGLIMNLRQHDNGGRPSPAGEHTITWWWPAGSLGNPNPVDTLGNEINKGMSMVGRWRDWPAGTPPTPTQIQAWDARWVVHGTVNSDTLKDQDYTIEMRFDLGMNGYDVTQPSGDIVEWNAQMYDCDWFWPLTSYFRFTSVRTWVQSPWGNTSWFSNVHILARPDITVSSGPVTAFGPDLRIPNAGAIAAPTIDGFLDEPVWVHADSLQIKWGDDALRASYKNTGPYRSGQYQPAVNGNQDPLTIGDPSDCSVKYFFKGSKLYLGFNFNDQVVQAHDLVDRWDGAIISINDRVLKGIDQTLISHRLTFHVGPGGALATADGLQAAIDTGAVVCSLKLKEGTTVDTLGLDVDKGYTAEFAIDLTKFGYAADLGDHALYFGIDVMDGDSYIPITDSYGTRTWFFREYENQDGPCVAFMDPAKVITTDVGTTLAPRKLELLGNYPNPFRGSSSVHFRLPQRSNVVIEVIDLQGRVMATRAYGVQPAGEGHLPLPSFARTPGLYMYRVHVTDALSGAVVGRLSGKMLLLD
jgi:hypothetical protein